MKKFQSQLEQLLPAEELFFDATPGFGRYKPFLEQAIAHPAKMNTRLTEYLIKTLTKEGDVILDPMSGSGQTGVVAALLGRNAVCVELEEKFYKWQVETKVTLETSQTLSAKGKMSCVLGDARKLSALLSDADVIVSSPPYSSGGWKADEDPANPIKREEKRKLLYPMRQPCPGSYSNNPENIGNLSHGEIDAIVTSPPYSDAKKGGGHFKIITDKSLPTAYSFQNKDQIGNFKKETYLQAMLTVYAEMFKVLKADGQAIIIIKPFIRNKKVVDLPYQTWLLMQKCGFKLTKLFKLRLTQQSFWRILYQKKHPEVDVIAHEYVLVCQK